MCSTHFCFYSVLLSMYSDAAGSGRDGFATIRPHCSKGETGRGNISGARRQNAESGAERGVPHPPAEAIEAD